MVNPYNKAGKKVEVEAMFNSIAKHYDFLNHFLSFGIDVWWRKRLIKELIKTNPERVIDIATGTADLAIMAVKRGIPSLTGVDISEKMIEIGNQKILKQNLQERIDLRIGDAENLDSFEEKFDAAMVSFGVRNFEDLQKGLKNIAGVLKRGGFFYVLEFSQPVKTPFKQLYRFYSFKILPLLGKVISNDRRAYTYLPESIKEFPYGNEFLLIMKESGFTNCRFIPLSFQIATIYIGEKK